MSDPQLRWLRLWTDIVDDAKLLLLSPADRWYYVALLTLKRNGMLDEGDEIAVSDRKVGVRLRLDDRERDELRRRLIEARLIDERWQPSGWDKRQFESDVSTNRVRKFRRNKKRFGNVSETSPQRFGNAPETEQSQSRDRAEKKENPRALGVNPRAISMGLQSQAWQRWFDYRREIRKPLKPASISAAQQKLAAFGSDQVAVVEQSVANGWTGLFPLSAAPKPRRSEWE